MFSWEELKTSTPTSLPLSEEDDLFYRQTFSFLQNVKWTLKTETILSDYKLSFFYFQVQGEENSNTEIATFENLIDYISQDES